MASFNRSGAAAACALGEIRVLETDAARRRGVLVAGGAFLPCALGHAGMAARKREGDGATPKGRFALRRLLYRADRGPRPLTGLPARPLAPDMGWCDDAAHRHYNRAVRLPFAGHHERLWRDDHLYDLLLVIGHNDDPPVAGRGSAIFIHLADDGFRPTEGCIALRRADLTRLLPRLSPRTVLKIGQIGL